MMDLDRFHRLWRFSTLVTIWLVDKSVKYFDAQTKTNGPRWENAGSKVGRGQWVGDGIFVLSVPPHPNPLPKEGSHAAASRHRGGADLASNSEGSPAPWGEGWGEGER